MTTSLDNVKARVREWVSGWRGKDHFARLLLSIVAAIDDLASLVSTVGNSVIWQPGGPAGQAANVFTQATPNAALAAFALLNGDRTFFNDDAFGPTTFPSGAYSAGPGKGRATMAGVKGNASTVVVTFANGATLAGFPIWRDLNVTDSSATNVIELVSGDSYELYDTSIASTSNTGSFINAGVAALLSMFGRSRAVASVNHKVFTTSAGGALTIRLFDASTVAGATLASPAGTIALEAYSSGGGLVAPGAIPVGSTYTVLATAAQTQYAPVAGIPVWGAFPPATTQDAIDKLAAASSGGVSGTVDVSAGGTIALTLADLAHNPIVLVGALAADAVITIPDAPGAPVLIQNATTPLAGVPRTLAIQTVTGTAQLFLAPTQIKDFWSNGAEVQSSDPYSFVFRQNVSLVQGAPGTFDTPLDVRLPAGLLDTRTDIRTNVATDLGSTATVSIGDAAPFNQVIAPTLVGAVGSVIGENTAEFGTASYNSGAVPFVAPANLTLRNVVGGAAITTGEVEVTVLGMLQGSVQ